MHQFAARRLNFPGYILVSFLLTVVVHAADLDTSRFQAGFSAGMVTNLGDAEDGNRTEFITSGRRLGDILIKYRQDNGDWLTADTKSPAKERISTNVTRTEFVGTRSFTNSSGTVLEITNRFQVLPDTLVWTFNVQNQSDRPLEIGDLALPLPMNRTSGQDRKPLLKHSFISGHGSFLFWMRADSATPFLTMVPTGDTHLEYWDNSRDTGYQVYIHRAPPSAPLPHSAEPSGAKPTRPLPWRPGAGAATPRPTALNSVLRTATTVCGRFWWTKAGSMSRSCQA